ncbi:Protein of unknown function [Gryllus bimaculatus]|nr:Protein of unknown function [Gryllus bimaculatus]
MPRPLRESRCSAAEAFFDEPRRLRTYARSERAREGRLFDDGANNTSAFPNNANGLEGGVNKLTRARGGRRQAAGFSQTPRQPGKQPPRRLGDAVFSARLAAPVRLRGGGEWPGHTLGAGGGRGRGRRQELRLGPAREAAAAAGGPHRTGPGLVESRRAAPRRSHTAAPDKPGVAPQNCFSTSTPTTTSPQPPSPAGRVAALSPCVVVTSRHVAPERIVSSRTPLGPARRVTAGRPDRAWAAAAAAGEFPGERRMRIVWRVLFDHAVATKERIIEDIGALCPFLFPITNPIPGARCSAETSFAGGPSP